MPDPERVDDHLDRLVGLLQGGARRRLGRLEVLGRRGRGLLVERGDELTDRAEHRVDVGGDVVRHLDLARGGVEVEVGSADRANRPRGVLQAVVLRPARLPRRSRRGTAAYALANAAAAWVLSASDVRLGVGLVVSAGGENCQEQRQDERERSPSAHRRCAGRGRGNRSIGSQRVHGVEQRVGALDAARLAAPGHHRVVQERHLGGQASGSDGRCCAATRPWFSFA